jgi:hypothetical protein
MAKFPDITMTSVGLEMVARAASGQTADRFIVTKVKLGDGVSEGNIRDYTDIISPKKEVTLASYEDKGNGTFRYTFTYNNEGVKVGFYHREIGLFAKNGDTGEEKLVGYTNAGNYPGWIDDETRIQPYTRLMINVGIGDTDNASGVIDVSNAVTIEMLDEHDDDGNAHGNLIKRIFGTANATAESVKTSIQNWCKESIASIFGIASATQTNVKNKIKEWAQEQINSWLETLGIRYNIAQNGYICLGKLFGDAIIQWGLLILKKDHTQEPDSNFVQESLSLPLSLKIVVCGISTSNVLINTYCYIHATLPTLTIGRNPYNTDTKHYYLIVGK